MADTYPIIMDIVADLSSDLEERLFWVVPTLDNEIVRYAKIGNPYRFQVGLEEKDCDTEEPEFNHVYLSIEYDLGENDPGFSAKKIAPNWDMIWLLSRNTTAVFGGLGLGKMEIENGQAKNLFYHFGFKKDETTPNEMRAILREAITYICDYISLNADMLIRTQSSDKQ